MSHPLKRTSESAADSAAKTTKASDIHRAVSKTEVAKISTNLMQGIIDHECALVRLVEEIDILIDKARRLGLEIRESETPSSDAIQLLRGMMHTVGSTGEKFDAMLGMDGDKWSKMTELLDVSQ
jgi:hypothetical protein